jgi:hypothetical protein
MQVRRVNLEKYLPMFPNQVLERLGWIYCYSCNRFQPVQGDGYLGVDQSNDFQQVRSKGGINPMFLAITVKVIALLVAKASRESVSERIHSRLVVVQSSHSHLATILCCPRQRTSDLRSSQICLISRPIPSRSG